MKKYYSVSCEEKLEIINTTALPDLVQFFVKDYANLKDEYVEMSQVEIDEESMGSLTRDAPRIHGSHGLEKSKNDKNDLEQDWSALMQAWCGKFDLKYQQPMCPIGLTLLDHLRPFEAYGLIKLIFTNHKDIRKIYSVIFCIPELFS